MRTEDPQLQTSFETWALDEVPPFPWITTKVLQLFSTRTDDVEIKRLVELLRADAALGSELLRRANSALYGLKSQVMSLQHATVLLGMEQVKALAMTVGLGAYLKGALKLAVLRRCWRHSIGCALLAEELAPLCGLSPEQAYTAGLLHDLGRLALLTKYPQPYADLLSVVLENRFGLLTSERDLFDVDHCQAGAWLAGKWGFPEQLQRIAALHHDPPPNGPFDLLKLAHLSCRLADCLGFAVVESVEAGEPAEILTELPHRALTGFGVATTDLQERLTVKVNALE